MHGYLSAVWLAVLYIPVCVCTYVRMDGVLSAQSCRFLNCPGYVVPTASSNTLSYRQQEQKTQIWRSLLKAIASLE